MHWKNPYIRRKDFVELARRYPELEPFFVVRNRGKKCFDFSDPEGVRLLTSVLLKDDFGLDVYLPPDRLVPTVPQKLNYVLWVEDLLFCLKKSTSCFGIDIGCGASCIYSLLTVKRNPSWTFLATEIDQHSYQCALGNVSKNALDDKISLGGEVCFVKRMIADSQILGTTISWYTAMLGCKSSLQPLLSILSATDATFILKEVFKQGRTYRWGIAWTYLPLAAFKESDNIQSFLQGESDYPEDAEQNDEKEHPSKRIKYSEQRSSPSCKLTEVKLNSQHEKPTQQKHEVIKQTKELQRQQITLKQTNGFKSISRHHQSKSKKDLSLLKRKIKKPFKMTLTIPMEDTCRICESTLKELSDVTFNTVHNDEGAFFSGSAFLNSWNPKAVSKHTADTNPPELFSFELKFIGSSEKGKIKLFLFGQILTCSSTSDTSTSLDLNDESDQSHAGSTQMMMTCTSGERRDCHELLLYLRGKVLQNQPRRE